MGYRRFGYDGPREFCPLSAWEYFGYGILFMIPVLGWVMLLYCALSSSNINRRSYARPYFISILVVLLLLTVAACVACKYITQPEVTSSVESLVLLFQFLENMGG